MKTCSRCHKPLNDEDFNWKIKDIKRAYHCKKCSREYIKKHYNNNKKYYLKKARRMEKENRERNFCFMIKFLKSHPCVDCGETDILVLELDHRDRHDKEYNISVLVTRGGSMDRLTSEIAKCEVRCANCHRRKTMLENRSWRTHYAPVA